MKTAEGQAVTNSFNSKVGARDWLGLQWPEEYGGLEASPIENLIFDEAMGQSLYEELRLLKVVFDILDGAGLFILPI